MILEQEGLKVNYVPYSSTGKAMADFLGGHVSAGVGTASTALTLVPEKAVAVLNSSALPLPEKVAKSLGNPPLASKLGYKGAINFPNLVGVHPDTPNEIADRQVESLGHRRCLHTHGKTADEADGGIEGRRVPRVPSSLDGFYSI